MPESSPDREGGEDIVTDEEPAARAFWSGTISFGLVSIPVQLIAAQRGRPTSMRWLGPDGAPLRREYVCPEHGEALSMDEVVRGVELDDGSFVPVLPEELEALEPDRSRDIDLRRFVARDEVDEAAFERAYYLTPAGESPKAYRLLAATLEESGRVGIATFVLRGREHLVAIISRAGVLRMETLRFADELRPPAAAGLPVDARADPAAKRRLARLIARHALDAIPDELLADEEADALRARARAKLEAGEGVVELEEAPAAEEEEEAEDIVEVLRRSLGAKRHLTSHAERRARSRLEDLTKDELLERARAAEIEGRSSMTKDELIAALDE